ncbi:MAG: hypothetical protein LBI84_07025 [Propionibacteriaceae bacterium]|nr:hypothetical protein [Propionibacteriaceae bacterium]
MDTEKLIDLATQAIMERLTAPSGAKVTAFGDVPPGLLGPGCQVTAGRSPSDVEGADCIVMTMAAFRAFHGGAIPAGLAGIPPAAAVPTPASAPAPVSAPVAPAAAAPAASRIIDLTAKRLIHERDLKDSGALKGDVVTVGRQAIVTALARDWAHGACVRLVKE